MTHSRRAIAALFILALAALARADDAPPPATAAPAAPAASDAGDSGTAASAIVQDLGFSFASPKSKLVIVFDKDVTFEKTVSEADKQVIIDIPNAKIGKKFTRRIPTTDFQTNVRLISPYQSENRVRLTLQLRDNGGVEVSQDGKTLTVMIDNKQEMAEKPAEAPKDLNDSEKQAAVPDASKSADSAKSADGAAGPGAPATTTSGEASGSASTTSGSGSGDSLDQFMKSQDSHQYYGRHIWLQVQDADLTDVFRVVSEASEFNIVLSDLVKGRAQLNLTDIPWDEALDIILKSYHLGAERQGNVLRITTLDALTAEHDAEAAARRSQEQAEPLVVRIFPISFARADDLAIIIKDFMTRDTAVTGPGAPGQPGIPQPNPLASLQNLGAGGTAGLPVANLLSIGGYKGPIKGSIQIDERNNALIVRDTSKAMDTIKRIIKELDTPTPQILIEGKFVEVQESGTSSLSGRLYLNNREFDPVAQVFNFQPGNNNYAANFNTTVGSASGEPAQSPASFAGDGGMSFGFTPKAALLPGIGEIGAMLQLLEQSGTSKVIGSPRVVTQNKSAATISSGQNIFINGTNVTSGSSGSGTTTTSTTSTGEITATTVLSVTPQVTNEGSVLVNIQFSQDSVAPPVTGSSLTTNTKSVQTAVLVDSGGTIVIGGVYASNDSDIEVGIPVLRNLPIIGPLFGSKTKTTSKDELFIFLTPRILNEKEAGLTSG